MKLKIATFSLAVALLSSLAWIPLSQALGEAPETAVATATPLPLGETAPMVPLVVIRPGETQELLLTSACMRITRGTGLEVNPLNAEEFFNAAESCSVNGVTATIDQPDQEGDYAAIVEAGYKSCRLTVTALESAQPGIIDLHLSDNTCGGNCDMSVRVLVVSEDAAI